MFQTHSLSQFPALRRRSNPLAAAFRRTPLFLLLPALLWADPAVETPLSLRVRIYDYESLPPETLEAAKTVASNILRGAGVQVSWEKCRTRPEEPKLDASCETRLAAADIQIRIIGEAMAKKLRNSRDCLGYALVGSGSAAIAGVYHHRAVEMERRNILGRGPLLGAIVAHEIGHLLLQEQRHSNSGIMQGQWTHDTLRRIAIGRLNFTAEEAEQIRAHVRRSLAI